MVNGAVARPHRKSAPVFKRSGQVVLRPADGLWQAMPQSKKGRDCRGERATRAVRVLRPNARRDKRTYPIMRDEEVGRRIPFVFQMSAFKQNAVPRRRPTQRDQFTPDVIRYPQRNGATPQVAGFGEIGRHEGTAREKQSRKKGRVEGVKRLAPLVDAMTGS